MLYGHIMCPAVVMTVLLMYGCTDPYFEATRSQQSTVTCRNALEPELACPVLNPRDTSMHFVLSGLGCGSTMAMPGDLDLVYPAPGDSCTALYVSLRDSARYDSVLVVTYARSVRPSGYTMWIKVPGQRAVIRRLSNGRKISVSTGADEMVAFIGMKDDDLTFNDFAVYRWVPREEDGE